MEGPLSKPNDPMVVEDIQEAALTKPTSVIDLSTTLSPKLSTVEEEPESPIILPIPQPSQPSIEDVMQVEGITEEDVDERRCVIPIPDGKLCGVICHTSDPLGIYKGSNVLCTVRLNSLAWLSLTSF